MPDVEDVIGEIHQIDALLRRLNSPIAFCHNDINPSNIIYSADDSEYTRF